MQRSFRTLSIAIATWLTFQLSPASAHGFSWDTMMLA
jgi:hypothetical protein